MAKTAWLAKLDAPTWGTATSEEAAKTAWLAKLDAPTWGTAATALAGIASEAAYVADMTEACDDGDEVACDSLSREDEAKRAWLAQLDVPTWGAHVPTLGAAAAAVSAVASNVSASSTLSAEEIAKQAWLAKQDTPTWGNFGDPKSAGAVAMLGVGGQTDPSLMAGAPPQTQNYSEGVASTRARPMPDSTILVQGGSLRTWSYKSPAVEQVQVLLSTEGRPLDADIELWHGPDNTPVKMRIYVENGQLRPFSAVIETPRGPNTVAIRNIGQIEFPIAANVIADDVDLPSADCLSSPTTVQGGALRTYPFDPSVDSVEVLIKTDGRPLNARIELLQGPNNNKQVIELYTEDGCDRPFFCILETPGSGNVVRIVNTSPVEFPMAAAVVPHSINQGISDNVVLGGDVVIGGDVGW
jgi:hypothetical protein